MRSRLGVRPSGNDSTARGRPGACLPRSWVRLAAAAAAAADAESDAPDYEERFGADVPEEAAETTDAADAEEAAETTDAADVEEAAREEA
jgi:hypothetical protein